MILENDKSRRIFGNHIILQIAASYHLVEHLTCRSLVQFFLMKDRTTVLLENSTFQKNKRNQILN
jgi:hypothetical protein